MNIAEYIEAVEAGYREIGAGAGAAFPRENLWIQGVKRDSQRGGHLPAGSKASFKFKAALLPGLGGAGVQAYTAGLPSGLETFLFLFDTDTGALAAIMEVLYYDWLKTAAVSALAAKCLAPAGSAELALFGTGRHARSQLYALSSVFDLRRVNAYSRDAVKRRAFCEKMSAELDLDVSPASSPAEALRNADIVVTITTSPAPVFAYADLPDKPCTLTPWARIIPGCGRLTKRPCSRAAYSSTSGGRDWRKMAKSSCLCKRGSLTNRMSLAIWARCWTGAQSDACMTGAGRYSCLAALA